MFGTPANSARSPPRWCRDCSLSKHSDTTVADWARSPSGARQSKLNGMQLDESNPNDDVATSKSRQRTEARTVPALREFRGCALARARCAEQDKGLRI